METSTIPSLHLKDYSPDMNIQKDTWRFLDTGRGSALFNMALDEAIFRAASRGQSPPTIRLYEWCPEAITLGYAQKQEEVIDYERCVNDGVDVTRRLTGGRAVFHKREITYSVTGSITDRHFGGNICETYRSISAVLCEGINKLGVDALLYRVKSKAGKANTGGHVLPCYSSTSRYEITVRRKKFVGSAQRRFQHFFLQQGSILTGSGYEKITDYMRDRELAVNMRRLLLKKSIDLSTVLKESCDTSKLKFSLKASFEKKLGAKFTVSNPTDAELECARQLSDERYGSKGWVLHYG